jgi:YVTN family beta-propeller protein
MGTLAGFRNLAGIDVTADGRTLYVADEGNNVVRQIDTTSGNVTTTAGVTTE